MSGLRVAILMLLTLMVGCQQTGRQFMVSNTMGRAWPSPPDPARVRYVDELTSARDVNPRIEASEVWNELLYGPKPPAALVNPSGVAVHPLRTQVAVADPQGKCVHVFDWTKRQYAAITTVDSSEDLVESPVSAVWVQSSLWVADAKKPGLARLALNEKGEWQSGRWLGAAFQRPAGLAFNPKNQLCYATDAAEHQVVAMEASGSIAFEFGSQGAGPGQFNFPTHVACGPDGSIVVADSMNFRIQRFGPDGTFLSEFGRKGDAAGDLALPKGVAVDTAGNIWVVDAHFENVQAFTPEGRLLMSLGREGHDPGEFWLPNGLCIDTQNRMWVADTYNNRVQVFQLLDVQVVTGKMEATDS